jgi:hypothetical protein
LYEIHSKKRGSFEGDLVSISRKAIEMGLSQEQISIAYQVMAEKKDLVAEFGISGKFMYSHSEIK